MHEQLETQHKHMHPRTDARLHVRSHTHMHAHTHTHVCYIEYVVSAHSPEGPIHHYSYTSAQGLTLGHTVCGEEDGLS